MKQKSKKQQEAFNKRVETYLLSIGAILDEGTTYCKGYKLETICGELNIHLHEAERSMIYSIFTRFEDVEKAKQYLPHGYYDQLNGYSGKWNWHLKDDTVLFHAFKHNIESLKFKT